MIAIPPVAVGRVAASIRKSGVPPEKSMTPLRLVRTVVLETSIGPGVGRHGLGVHLEQFGIVVEARNRGWLTRSQRVEDFESGFADRANITGHRSPELASGYVGFGGLGERALRRAGDGEARHNNPHRLVAL